MTDYGEAAHRRVAVVIPARNAAATLGAQLEALSAQHYRGDWEVLVVDNGSTDGTAELVQSWRHAFVRLKIVAAPTPTGASVARNAGCLATDADLLLFCDADDLVAPGWVDALAQGLRVYPAVGGTIERRLLNSAAAVAGRPPRFDGLLDTFHFLPYPLTANCGVRRYVWEQLCGFNVSYTHGSDDCDFFWRAQLAGYEVGFVPEAVVHYRLRETLGDMMRQYFDYGHSHVRLFRDFSSHGMPASPLSQILAAWSQLAATSLRPWRSREGRAAWGMQLAMRAGRLTGSIRYRTAFF